MDWKKIIGTVAPTIATALGGPFAGVAVRAIAAKVLGKPDASEAEVADAVFGASPEQLIKLKELDLEFKKQMADVGVHLEQIEAEDRASARARQVALKDHTPTVLGGIILAGFLGGVWFVCTQPISAQAQPVVMAMLGTLGTLATTVVAFYFGSSSGSRAKDATISSLTNGSH